MQWWLPIRSCEASKLVRNRRPDLTLYESTHAGFLTPSTLSRRSRRPRFTDAASFFPLASPDRACRICSYWRRPFRSPDERINRRERCPKLVLSSYAACMYRGLLPETLGEMERRVSVRRVAAQRARVERLEGEGLDASGARRLLAISETSLAVQVADRDRLIAELGRNAKRSRKTTRPGDRRQPPNRPDLM